MKKRSKMRNPMMKVMLCFLLLLLLVAGTVPVISWGMEEEAGPNYTATIDLSAKSDNVTGAGYTVTGGPPRAYDPKQLETAPSGVVRFNAGANGNVYQIIQSGVPNNPDPRGKKYGSSMVRSIVVPSGVNVTLVISDIHLIDSIVLEGTAQVTLLLDEKNYIRGSITVPVDSRITIDSLNGSDTSDLLIMPTDNSGGNNAAKIGGPGVSGVGVSNTAGTITINGGGIDITAKSTGAGIGGGGNASGSPAGTGGNITINGGIISVTQQGSGGVSGAGIGGGGGSGSTSGSTGASAGNLQINGGTVTVRQSTRAAGIGGGSFGPAGNITITGGVIDVEVLSPGEGAAIGNASGTNPGYGSINISGGAVRAVSSTIGIGRMHGSTEATGNHLNITISGGSVYAKGYTGAGIGYFAHPMGSTIKITGGSIIAESERSAGIGGHGDTPNFHLDAAADVKAFSGGSMPAFNVADNTGNGYFVNASLNRAISATMATTLNVHNSGALLKSLNLPANFRHFAYSADISTSRTDNVFALNGSTVLGAIVRVADDSRDIYSVKTRNGYQAHGGTNGSLPVKFLGKESLSFIVTAKHVDVDGNPIPGMTDTVTKVNLGDYFSKPLPGIDGYMGLGHIWNTLSSGSYTEGDPNLQIFGNMTLYYVYELIPSMVDVSVSKTIAGEFANTSRYFTFTVCFNDKNGAPLAAGTVFTYEGSSLAGSEGNSLVGSGALAPAGGTLVLDEQGEATFALTDGQMITIKDVAGDGQIRIIEALDGAAAYRPSFTDSKDSLRVDSNDTGVRILERDEDRSFDFVNTCVTPPPVGVADSASGPLLLLVAVALAKVFALVGLAPRIYRRLFGQGGGSGGRWGRGSGGWLGRRNVGFRGFQGFRSWWGRGSGGRWGRGFGSRPLRRAMEFRSRV